jgi:phage FluMu protein Com
VQTDFKDFNKKEQVKLFKMIKLYKFQPTIGDFNHIYWNYCQGIKPNSVFKLLLEVNEKETKKCIKCKEEFISDGFQRYCPKCARINHNLSKSESYIDF